MSSKANPLASLIGNYDDSDEDSHEDENKETQFDVIAAKIHSNSVTHPPPIAHCPWSACYDEESGYTYYWNHKTNEVTWQPPKEYLYAIKIAAQLRAKGKSDISAEEWRIYQKVLLEKEGTKVKKNDEPTKSLSENVNLKLHIKPTNEKKRKPPHSDSDEEVNIEPIQFYDKTDSDSNDESFEKQQKEDAKLKKMQTDKIKMELVAKKKVSSKPKLKKVKKTNELVQYGPSLPPNDEYTLPIGPELPTELKEQSGQNTPELQENEDSQDEEKLVSEIKAKAKLLQKLGGELPTEVSSLIDSPKSPHDVEHFLTQIENEIKKPKPLFPSVQNITDDIIRASFEVTETKNDKVASEKPANQYENSSLQEINRRKKRLDKDLLPEPKRVETPGYTTKYSQIIDDYTGFRTGLGFSNGDKSPDESSETKSYIGFTKGETLNDGKGEVDMKDESELLEAKLKFLNEQLPTISPVQEMSVQLQTLLSARKAGALTVDYWHRFVKGTADSLLQLEARAAPSGWTTTFQREAERYVYKRTSDGHEQWDYPFESVNVATGYDKMAAPEPKIAAVEEHNMASDDMDLCTTPPPPSISEGSWPHSPSPPPPPRITAASQPPPTPPLPPLPPPQPPRVPDDDLLQSFYSDIASLEPKKTEPSKTVSATPVVKPIFAAATSTKTNPSSSPPPTASEKKESSDVSGGQSKPSKKKSKVKLSGIKNKNVSSMVAKWQQVQEEIGSD